MIEKLWGLSYASGGEIDWSTYDLDAPMPQRVGNGETTTVKAIIDGAGDKTLREALSGEEKRGLNFIGAPRTLAEQMNEVIEATGRPDGYLVESVEHSISRRHVIEVTDGLCPELKRRGFIRDGYAKRTFRENLADW
jgi:alkanesulfonate monooxygenase SsuD/methylene tetrahydromethanopterin reductase-like flavin-dependent oxidoreductase (luciferase family)